MAAIDDLEQFPIVTADRGWGEETGRLLREHGGRGLVRFEDGERVWCDAWTVEPPQDPAWLLEALPASVRDAAAQRFELPPSPMFKAPTDEDLVEVELLLVEVGKAVEEHLEQDAEEALQRMRQRLIAAGVLLGPEEPDEPTARVLEALEVP